MPVWVRFVPQALLSLALGLPLACCGPETTAGGGEDSGHSIGHDAGATDGAQPWQDAGRDAGADAGLDAGADAGADAASPDRAQPPQDAGHDAAATDSAQPPQDAGRDAATTDGAQLPQDAGRDAGSADVGDVATVEQWRVFEIELHATQAHANPFLDVELRATFTHEDGTTITRPGFWYGGDTFMVRFAPTVPGRWTFETTAASPADPGLHGQTGALLCVPYSGDRRVYQHGFLEPSGNGRFLQHRDGTPFFYLGDTHWFMESEDYQRQFLPTLQRRLQQGYTVYQSHPSRTTLSNAGATAIDPAVYQDLDRYFAAIAEAGLVHAFGLCCHSAIDYFTPDGAARLARYMNARYGAYPVIFFTSQEVDLWDNADRWKAAFDAWNAVDDYRHPATCHVIGSTSGEPTLWGDDPEHDLFFLQAGHGTLHGVAHYQAYWSYSNPTKPFVEAEANYEEILLGGENHADRVRQAAYKALQTGAAGFGYGANGLWNNCFSDADCSCCEDWGIDPWYSAIHFPAGAQMRHLRAFYAPLSWWNLWPRFIDASWGEFTDAERSVLKSYGSDYFAVYFYGSSSAGTIKRMQGTYSGYWFDPRTGAWTLISDAITPSGGAWSVPAKPDAADWLLLLARHGATEVWHRTVTTTASAGGRVHPGGLALLPRWETASLALVPQAGYQVADVLVDGQSRGAPGAVLLAADGQDHTVHATFAGAPVAGLLAEWRLDGVVEDVALDTAGAADGRYQGAAFVDAAGVLGGCADLDGQSGTVTMGDASALEGMAALTVALWVQLDRLPAENAVPVGKESAWRWIVGSSGSAHFVLATANAAWYAAGTLADLGGVQLAPGEWHHLAATYDGAWVRTYLDGQPAGNGAAQISGSVVTNSSDVRLGNAEAHNAEHLDGRLDEVRVYNRALSAAEISALYQSY